MMMMMIIVLVEGPKSLARCEQICSQDPHLVGPHAGANQTHSRTPHLHARALTPAGGVNRPGSERALGPGV
jgi:hypothetical protein